MTSRTKKSGLPSREKLLRAGAEAESRMCRRAGGVALVGSDSVVQNSWKGLRVGQNVDTSSLFGAGDVKAQDRTCDGFLDPLTWSQWKVGSFWFLTPGKNSQEYEALRLSGSCEWRGRKRALRCWGL